MNGDKSEFFCELLAPCLTKLDALGEATPESQKLALLDEIKRLIQLAGACQDPVDLSDLALALDQRQTFFTEVQLQELSCAVERTSKLMNSGREGVVMEVLWPAGLFDKKRKKPSVEERLGPILEQLDALDASTENGAKNMLFSGLKNVIKLADSCEEPFELAGLAIALEQRATLFTEAQRRGLSDTIAASRDSIREPLTAANVLLNGGEAEGAPMGTPTGASTDVPGPPRSESKKRKKSNATFAERLQACIAELGRLDESSTAEARSYRFAEIKNVIRLADLSEEPVDISGMVCLLCERVELFTAAQQRGMSEMICAAKEGVREKMATMYALFNGGAELPPSGSTGSTPRSEGAADDDEHLAAAIELSTEHPEVPLRLLVPHTAREGEQGRGGWVGWGLDCVIWMSSWLMTSGSTGLEDRVWSAHDPARSHGGVHPIGRGQVPCAAHGTEAPERDKAAKLPFPPRYSPEGAVGR